MEPEVVRTSGLAMQVCVPKDWNDELVMSFAERENPCGTDSGWQIRKDGDKQLTNDPERNPCRDKTRKGFVHITLDA